MTSTARKTAANKQADPIRFVADDNGYADHKFAWYDGKGDIQVGKVPSRVQLGAASIRSAANGAAVGGYQTQGETYTCGNLLRDPLNLRNGDYPTSPANRVLFTHGLATFGLLDGPIRACVTLPLRDYYKRDGGINEAIKEAAMANFMENPVEVIGAAQQPDILSVNVYAEAMCGYFDWLLTDSGEARQEVLNIQGEIAVVDIGGSTTDIVSLQYDKQLVVNNDNSGTEKVGVLDAKDQLTTKIREAMIREGHFDGGHDDQLPKNFIDDVLMTGKGRWMQREWDFTAERDESCQSVAQRLTTYIKTTLGGVGNYEAIVVIGGGSIVFRPWLENMMRNAIFSDEYANARGALKFMRMCEVD